MKKKVSVVVPCYKLKQEWLERLFASIYNQTIGFASLEVIFVVDASEDDTFERLQKLEQQYEENVLLINCEEKVGPGGARTLGIQYASGEYISFVDQDDWIEEEMYAHMYEKAAEYDCDVVESYNTRDDVVKKNRKLRTGKEDAFYCLDTAEKRKAFFREDAPERRKYWAKIYRRNFLLEHQLFFPELVKYDDNYFKGMVFYHAQRVYVLEEYLYHWMMNENSISMTQDVSSHVDRMKVELLKLEEYQRRGLLEVYRDEMEYIFLEQFYANTLNTIWTRNGGMSMELFDYMRNEVKTRFPEYRQNPYIALRNPVWAMGRWIENALKGIAQVRGSEVQVPQAVRERIADWSFLDLIEQKITQEELNWYSSIYVAFDKVAAWIDYQRL